MIFAILAIICGVGAITAFFQSGKLDAKKSDCWESILCGGIGFVLFVLFAFLVYLGTENDNAGNCAKVEDAFAPGETFNTLDQETSLGEKYYYFVIKNPAGKNDKPGKVVAVWSKDHLPHNGAICESNGKKSVLCIVECP